MNSYRSGINGVEAIQNFEIRCPGVKVLIQSKHEDKAYVTYVLKTGVFG
ncbi:hypothetical protein HUG20_16955 [Salicibibacter cibi]|uniref:Uncharacterized protein n=1 Tax=Salicibibacter cibi TaxID=2743001 RepID=A0A7T6ZE76_9BACI|nr:hypothetical protein [Salicibibacter cibi]QQK81431.1 hypothetical protein HUG20_16955 [Salicibibacter cibi]